MAAMGWWEKSRIHQALKRLIAGPGIEVDSTTPSAPVVSAKISTDPSNALSFGTDDGLYVPPSAAGTVTSVGMSVPSFLSVSGSPVTTSGTLAVTYSGTALPIANGGSGQTTANAALNAFLPAQATHSGKVLQTDGANASWQPSVGANSGTGYASGITNLSSDATWFDTGASVSLTAGTYLVTSFCHGLQVTSAGIGQINSRLYNVTDASAVTDSECKVVHSGFIGASEATGTISLIVTVASTKSIRLEAQRSAAGTYSSVSARNNSSGRSGITYVRIY